MYNTMRDYGLFDQNLKYVLILRDYVEHIFFSTRHERGNRPKQKIRGAHQTSNILHLRRQKRDWVFDEMARVKIYTMSCVLLLS